MSILDYFLAGGWQKKAPATEDTGAYSFNGKDTTNMANSQTFAGENENADEWDEWDEDILRWQREQEARSRGEYVKPDDDDELPNDGPRWHPPTPTEMVAKETPPITEGEILYTAAPIATETPPPITTTTPANVNNVNITGTPIYYNFPITVVAGFMDDPHAALRRMIAWPTYDKTRRMKHERGRDRLFYAMAHMEYEVADKQAWYNECGETYHLYKGPRCGISRKMWLEATESVDYWENADKVLFLAFIAAKSIQGNKPYALTCNRQMCARMNGRATTYASDEEMREQSNPIILAYFTRKRRQRMRRELEQQYRVSTYSQKYIRGYYISTQMPLDRLAKAVERKRAKTAKSYAERMREAGDNARAYIAVQQE